MQKNIILLKVLSKVFKLLLMMEKCFYLAIHMDKINRSRKKNHQAEQILIKIQIRYYRNINHQKRQENFQHRKVNKRKLEPKVVSEKDILLIN
jgi:hypothetical protein